MKEKQTHGERKVATKARNLALVGRFQELFRKNAYEFSMQKCCEEFNLGRESIRKILNRNTIYKSKNGKRKAATKARNLGLVARFQELFPTHSYEFSMKAVCEEFNLDRDWIRKILNKNAVYKTKSYKRKERLVLSPLEVEQINILELDCCLEDLAFRHWRRFKMLLLANEGKTIMEISKEVVCSHETVRKWLRRFLEIRPTLPKVEENPERPHRQYDFHERSWEEILDDRCYEYRYALYVGMYNKIPDYHRLKLHKLTVEQGDYLRKLAHTDPFYFELDNYADLKYKPTYWTLDIFMIAAINNLQPCCMVNATDLEVTRFPGLAEPLKISWCTLKKWFQENEIDLKAHPYWNPYYHGGEYKFKKESFYWAR